MNYDLLEFWMGDTRLWQIIVQGRVNKARLIRRMRSELIPSGYPEDHRNWNLTLLEKAIAKGVPSNPHGIMTHVIRRKITTGYIYTHVEIKRTPISML